MTSVLVLCQGTDVLFCHSPFVVNSSWRSACILVLSHSLHICARKGIAVDVILLVNLGDGSALVP